MPLQQLAIARMNPERMRSVRTLALCASALALVTTTPALADITYNNTYNASSLGSGTQTFSGGTVKLDTTNTVSQAFILNVPSSGANTIDENAHSAIFSGIFSNDSAANAGSITYTDSVGGGNVTLTGVSTYTGTTTINSGATLTLGSTGTIATSSQVNADGTFDISQTAGASIVSLGGSGVVTLGSAPLTISAGAGDFTGVISGSGSLTVSSGIQILSGNNTYTGGTNITAGTLQLGDGASSGMILGSIGDNGTLAFDRSDNISFGNTVNGTGGLTQSGTGVLTLTVADTYSGPTNVAAGTLALSSTGSITASSNVTVNGTFDVSATNGASIKSLGGAGVVTLGSQILTISNGSGTFSGVIQGAGGLLITGGTETLTGANTYTGTTTVNGGILRLGSSVMSSNIADNATVSFFSSAAVSVTGVISGSGIVTQTGNGTTTINTAQTYTGATTISLGTLALSGAGSIAISSNVEDDSNFDISAAGNSGAAIASLSGSGSVQLGSQTLTLTNASGKYSGTMAGTGNLVLASGSETLSATSTFTGQTTIAAAGKLLLTSTAALSDSARVVDNGTLDVSGVTTSGLIPAAQIVSLSGNGQVILGTQILQITNGGDTFSGVISGTGGLIVSGGTETLTGANTYTGATTISAGILKISGNGAISAAGVVTDNGTLDVSGAASSVSLGGLAGTGNVTLGANNLNLVSGGGSNFSGAIAGTGSLTVSGSTQILSGASTYSGGTIISGGTLQLGNANAGGSIAGNVIDNGTLAFDRNDTAAFSGIISGTGNVTQIGVGTTALTAANTYSGGTTITAGTLQIGNGGTSGNITGNVANSGTLAFDRSDATSFSGNISGTGGVSLIGTGTLTLTGVESYTGTTSIASGSTLIVNNGASIVNSSDVVDSGVLDLTAVAAPQLASLGGASSGSVLTGANTLTLTAGSDTFAGSITGTGGLTVTGGTQGLSGTNNYTGATVVNGGTLNVSGAITKSSGVTVNSGGTVAGTGALPTTVIASGGTLAPGAGMTIASSLSMASGSTFAATVSSASLSKVTVNGTAAIAGTLTVNNGGGNWLLGQKETVLTATNGVAGTFAAAPITSTGAQYASTISYDANDVFVTVNLSKLMPLLPTGATANAAAPIAGIDAAIAKGDSVPTGIQNLANLSSSALGTAAPQLAAELAADLPQAGAAMMSPFLDSIVDHQMDGQASGRGGAWISGYGASDLVNGNATAGIHKFKQHNAGVVLGLEKALSPNVTIGGALSFGSSNYHLTGGDGTGSADTLQGGIYGNMRMGRMLYGAFQLALASDTMSTQRTVTTSATDQLIGHAKALAVAGRYEEGISLGWLTPYAAIADTMVRTPGYAETAAAGSANTFALHYAARSSNFADLELGVRQRSDTQLGRYWTLVLTDRLAWQHTLSGVWDAQANFASVPDSTFTTFGSQPTKDSGLLTLGAELRDKAGFNINLHVDSQVGRNSQSYAAIGGIGFTW